MVARSNRGAHKQKQIPPEFSPIDSQEVRFCLQLTGAAATYKMPMKSPASTPINIVDETGEMQRYRLADKPLSRAFTALAEHFAGSGPDDQQAFEKQMAVTFRIVAMTKILKHPLAKKWVRRSEEHTEIHEALIDAASSLPLTKNAEFDAKTFFEVVKQIARAKYDAGSPS